MKRYQKPRFELATFSTKDVITFSFGQLLDDLSFDAKGEDMFNE